ncbi:MAG: hypothetical protein IPG89_14925 [Bacteroidetes bacterium]|nr:hypothetical protein [Bacteroidota bacterium]
MKNIFLFFTLLLCIQTSAQGWKLELSSNVEIKTWKLTSKSEVKSAPLLGATIKLMKGSTLIEQTKSDGNGDFTVHVPAGDVFIIEVSYPGCTTKRFEADTKNVPDFGEEIFKPSFSIGGFILSKPFQGIDYSGLQKPLVRVTYHPKIKNFDDDENYTQQGLGVVGKIYDAEDVLIQNFCSTNKQGDDAMKIPDCPLAKKLYEKAMTIIPGEQYPVQQLAKVGECLKAKEEAEKAIKAKEEAARLAKEKEAADKIAKEKEAAAKIEAEKIAKEKEAAAKLEAERIAKEKEAADKIEKEKAAAAKIEADRIAKEKENASKAEQEKLAKEKEAADKLAKQKEKEEKDRIAKEKAEQEKLAKEKAKKDKEEADRIAKENSIKTTKTVDTYTTSTHQGNTTITTTVTTTLTTTVTTGSKETKIEPVKEPVVVKEPEVVTTNTVQATPKDPQENKMNIYGTGHPQENSGAEGSKHHNVRTVIGEDKYKVTIKKADEYLKMKRYKEAKDTYNEALEIKPNDKYATAKLAEIEKKTAGK